MFINVQVTQIVSMIVLLYTMHFCILNDNVISISREFKIKFTDHLAYNIVFKVITKEYDTVKAKKGPDTLKRIQEEWEILMQGHSGCAFFDNRKVRIKFKLKVRRVYYRVV
jgi:hypothetical protein